MVGYGIIRLIILVLLYSTCNGSHVRNKIGYRWQSGDTEVYHYPGYFTSTPGREVGPDTKIPHPDYTPDFRLAEPHFTPYDKKFFREYNRPYRLTPIYAQTYYFDWNEKPWLMGCYCATVYRKYHIIGTCAIITIRHVLTTATSIDVVLRNYKPTPVLHNILGIMYDHDEWARNTTLYHPGVSRIHYHPLYKRDYETNVSHPIPCMYDLAVLSSYFNLGHYKFPKIKICQRAGSTKTVFTSTVAKPGDRHFAIGYLFMKAFNRRPLPYFKFGVRTDKYIYPCPKQEWQWFHCIQGEWARLGMDSGGALHLMDLKKHGREDGLSGICAFSLKLRSKDILHYYTVVDTHKVLDFLYDAYNGYIPYEWLDARFIDSRGLAPRLYAGYYINVYYTHGYNPGRGYWPPNYRR